MIYWDTSCVLKLYTSEADSPAYLVLASQSQETPGSSDLLKIEFYYSLLRKELVGDIRRKAAEFIFRKFTQDIQDGRFLLFPLGDEIQGKAREVARLCFSQSEPISLRTLDGIHLATALAIKADSVATTDKRMRAAAKLLGLRIA